LKQRALEALKGVRHHRNVRIDLIALALHGKKVSFDKVLKMIDDMVKLLDKEQHDDDLRQEVCHEELDEAEDKLKAAEHKVASYGKAIKVDKAAIEQADSDAKELADGMQKLDKAVEDATEIRKEEHSDYEATLVENKAAKELLLVAKNRLMKFYNPTLAKDAPKASLVEQEQTVQSTQNLGVATLIQVNAHAHAQILIEGHPQPVGGYKSKHNEGMGVIEMIDSIVTDLDKEITEQETEEKDAQSDYETVIDDSKIKRTKDGKLIEKKELTEADLKVELQKLRALEKAKLREAYAATGVLGELHQDCDWLLMNYDARKEARAAEKDSLAKAKGVLAGMD